MHWRTWTAGDRHDRLLHRQSRNVTGKASDEDPRPADKASEQSERYITARLVASHILGLFPGMFAEEVDDGSTWKRGTRAVLA
jgi:hypothetical protein